MATKKLPFKLSAKAITDWLQSLSQSNSASSANQLNNVVKILRIIRTDENKLLKALIQLTPSALLISSSIESSLVTEKNTDNPRKIKNLCIQLLRNLSLAFCSVIKKESLAEDDKNQAIYIALQLIGHTLRLSSLYHQFPSAKLWEKTSELYSIAQDRGILEQTISHKILGLESLPTIAIVLKRNILFTLLSPYHYSTSEVIKLYSISEQYAHLLTLSDKESPESKCFWVFKQGYQPSIKSHIEEQSNTGLNINTDELLSLLQSSRFSSSLDKITLENIAHQLSGYKDIFSSVVPSAFDTQHLIIGFSEINKYLEKAEKLDNIQKLSNQAVDDGAFSTLSLEPMDFQKGHLKSSLAPTASNSYSKLLRDIESVKIIQTRNKHFIIAETSSKICAIGNITLLCDSNDASATLGIIRQIRTINPMTTSKHILIEKIEGAILANAISSPKILNKQIISIHNKNAKTEILISPSKLASRTQINLTSNDKYILGDLVDHSPFYMRYVTY